MTTTVSDVKCELCGAPLNDEKLHIIPGNDTDLCSHMTANSVPRWVTPEGYVR